MKTLVHTKYYAPEVFDQKENVNTSTTEKRTEALSVLEKTVLKVLETYSNVHRGSGHYSMITTHLFEKAREIVLEYLSLNKRKYVVVFCSPRRAEIFENLLKPGDYQCLSSKDFGIHLGLRAFAVKRKALPKGIPFETGGGSARLVSPNWVIWAKSPDKFEAGTPPIVNVIAFAKVLLLCRQYGNNVFQNITIDKHNASDILYNDELQKYSGQELLEKLQKSMIGNNVQVPTSKGIKRFINLDNAASTQTFSVVWDAVQNAWQMEEQTKAELIKEVKSICADFLGSPLTNYDVIFTSNTTESINLVAENMRYRDDREIQPVVLNTILEHTSNELPWRMISGYSQIRIPVDADGFIDTSKLESVLCAYNQENLHKNKRIVLVAISGASNVLGTYNNLPELCRIAHQYGARILVDAAQLVAHRKVEIENCGIDYFAFSAHKVYAPFGTGVLIVRKGLLNFSARKLELIQSAGEENIAGIAALGKVLLILKRIGLELIQQKEMELTKKALNELIKIPGLKLFGIKETNSPKFIHKGGVIAFGMKGIMPNKIAKKLAFQEGIGLRYGCHCAHLLIKNLLRVSPFLEHFQGLLVKLFPKLSLPGLVRISFGIGNGEEDLEQLIKCLKNITLNPKNKEKNLPDMKEFLSTMEQRVFYQK